MLRKPEQETRVPEPIVVHPEKVGKQTGVVSIPTPESFTHGPKGVELPKYDPESFPEADRVKIPDQSTFVDHDGLVYKVAVDLHRGKVPMMWGPSGVGKTQLARHMAFLMQVPFERIPLWVQSRLARSFGRPGVICIDEWNAAPPAVLHVARPVLDDSAQLALDAYDGRILLKHDHNFIVATGNPDWMPQYAGLLPLSEADADRLSHIMVGWPKPVIEAEILLNHVKSRGLDKVPAWQVVCGLVAWSDLRSSIDDGDVGVTAGTRSLMNFVELLQYHPVREAMSKVYERMGVHSFGKVMHVLDHHDWDKYHNPTALDLATNSPDPVHDLLAKMPSGDDE